MRLTAKVRIRMHSPMGGWTAGDTLLQMASCHMVASRFTVASPQGHAGWQYRVANPQGHAPYVASTGRQVHGGKYMAASTWRQVYHLAASTWWQVYHVAASTWQQACGSKITGP